MKPVLFLALDARYTHANPALRSILAYVRHQIPPEDLPPLLLLEQNINQNLDQILGHLLESKPRAIFISAYIWNYRLIQDLIPCLRHLLPDCLLGLGGPEVSFTPAQTFQELPDLDLLFLGEGEASFAAFLPLLKQLPEDRSAALRELRVMLPQLPGLALLAPDASLLTAPAAPLLPLDAIPFLYEEGFKDLAYRYVYYESSRGCPFHCSYCLSSRDHSLRFLSLERVFSDLKQLLEAGPPLVKLIDRSFNADRERARRIWRFLIEESRKANRSTRFHFEIEAGLLDDEDLDLLAETPPGLFQFEVGIQSFSPEILRAVHRHPDTAHIVRALQRLARDGRIPCHADLIFGLPGQDFASCAQSFREALLCRSDALQLGFLKILKGTEMAKEACRRGYGWQPFPPYEVLRSDGLSADDLFFFKRFTLIFERFWNQSPFPTAKALLLDAAEDQELDSFALFRDITAYFQAWKLLEKPLSLEEFALRFHDALREINAPACLRIADAIRQDLVRRERRSDTAWARMRQRYPEFRQ